MCLTVGKAHLEQILPHVVLRNGESGQIGHWFQCSQGKIPNLPRLHSVPSTSHSELVCQRQWIGADTKVHLMVQQVWLVCGVQPEGRKDMHGGESICLVVCAVFPPLLMKSDVKSSTAGHPQRLLDFCCENQQNYWISWFGVLVRWWIALILFCISMLFPKLNVSECLRITAFCSKQVNGCIGGFKSTKILICNTRCNVRKLSNFI